MRKILIAGVAVLCLTGTAHAAELPKNFLGDWCNGYLAAGSDNRYIYSRVREGIKCEDHIITVRPRMYQIVWDDCVFDKVKKIRVNMYQTHAKCEAQSEGGGGGIGIKWTSNEIFEYSEEGELLIITKLPEG